MPSDEPPICACGYNLSGIAGPPWLCPECGSRRVPAKPEIPDFVPRAENIMLAGFGCFVVGLVVAVAVPPIGILMAAVGHLILSIGVGLKTASKRTGKRRWLGVLTGVLAFVVPIAILITFILVVLAQYASGG